MPGHLVANFRIIAALLATLALVACAKTAGNQPDGGRRSGAAAHPGAVQPGPGTVSVDHGFGGTPPTPPGGSLPDLDGSKFANQPTFFAGDALRIGDECRSGLPPFVTFLADIWTQRLLLDMYAHGQPWFQQALESLQEQGPRGQLHRATLPVHPDLLRRLNQGVNPDFWLLNGVRFRLFGDDQVQIKLNYELRIKDAGVLPLSDSDLTPSILSASLIHSIAIMPEHIIALKHDVLAIGSDTSVTGCRILKVLEKYVANAGQKASDKPRGSYFFLHANIFDVSPSIGQWVFTEFKVVTNDDLPFVQTLEVLNAAPPPPNDDPVGGMSGFPSPGRINLTQSFDPFAYYGVTRGQHLIRNISEPYDNPVTVNDSRRSLRIVPMEFPLQRAIGTQGDIEPITDQPPVRLWFSGHLTDDGKHQQQMMGMNSSIHLLFDAEDRPITDRRHPAFRNDKAFTCGQCHTRETNSELEASSGKLKEAPSMQIRHIGWGDGGYATSSCNPLWGRVRASLRPSVSNFLLTISNSHQMNSYHSEWSGPAKPLPLTQCLTDGSGGCATVIDDTRCVIFRDPNSGTSF